MSLPRHHRRRPITTFSKNATTKGAKANAARRAGSQSPRTGLSLVPARRRGGDGSGAPTHRLRSLALLGAALGLLAVMVVPASAGAANAPWWKLVSNSRPSYLHVGGGGGAPGVDEVQEIIVEPEGTEAAIVVAPNLTPHEIEEEEFREGGECKDPKCAELTHATTEAEAQAKIEGLTGYAGNVEVHKVDALHYAVTFVGALAEQPVPLMKLGYSTGFGEVKEITKGRAAVPAADGEIYVTAANLGDANFEGSKGTITMTDTLPAGLEPVEVVGTRPNGADFQQRLQIPCNPISGQTATCTYAGTVLPFDNLEMKIAVVLKAGAHTGEPNQLTVFGGGGASASLTRPITVSSGPIPFGVNEYEQSLEEEGGAPSTQAGSHPFQYTTQITVNQGRDINPFVNSEMRPEVTPVGLAKDFAFKLPPGLIGSATAIPQCTTAEFFHTIAGLYNLCPPDTAVGAATVTVHEPATVGTSTLTLPIFNMEPNFGEPARFAFYAVLANTPVFIDAALRSGSDYGITAAVNNLTQTGSVLSSTATFWGTPGDSRHDGQRGWSCLLSARGEAEAGACLPLGESNPRPLLTMPTQCTSALRAEGELDQWNVNQGVFAPFSGAFSPSGLLTACYQVPFGPNFAAQPTEKQSAAATGLTVDLSLKQEGLNSAAAKAESDIKRVTVALPAGITTNPSVANGLSACTLAQYQAEALGNQSCPESSKVGEVEIESPLVAPTIKGSVYVAKQHDNPADNLLSIYVVAKNPELGVLVKTAGAVTPNEQTGQLTTTFDELPQLPFTHFHFLFRTGQRAPLITPNLCGTYTTGADLYPYSNPNTALHRDATFTVSAGAGGGPCATQESQLPNKPTLEAGTLTPIAGAYSPFVFKVRRADGSQALSRIDATLPEGLLGKLAGVKECSDAQIAQAEGRSGEGQGALELASPSCPASSQVGVVNVGTGVGTQPYYVQGKAYLAGPYKGAPLSLAIITPAVVGPFDLGTIVVRTAFYVNEFTAQITAKSDPIPTIVHGLPTVIRSVALNMDKPNFTLNPTSCDPKQITGEAISTLGNVALLSQRFQVGACGALGLKPGLKISLKGAAKRGKFPALTATLTYPKGSYSNIARASVALPHSEFLAQNHIRTVCTRVQFNADAGNGSQCPKGSIYGKATATSPLLDKPLSGPVYLRSSSHPLPDLVVALHGQIDVALVGRIDSVNGGIRSTFGSVPDAPVSKFTLQMQGGKKGLLVNSTNICKSTNRAVSKLTAQNGKTYDTKPVLKAKCGKAKKKGKRHR
jgi:hypothetical protein